MTGYGIGFPKQSKFKDMINKELIDMHHSGMKISSTSSSRSERISHLHSGEIERLRRFWFTGKIYSSAATLSTGWSRSIFRCMSIKYGSTIAAQQSKARCEFVSCVSLDHSCCVDVEFHICISPSLGRNDHLLDHSSMRKCLCAFRCSIETSQQRQWLETSERNDRVSRCYWMIFQGLLGLRTCRHFQSS